MSKTNYYYNLFERYVSADSKIVEASKAHWEAIHKSNLESGREDLICFSAKTLEMINLAQGNLVQNCPKYIVKRVARNMTTYNLDLYDAFNEAMHAYANRLNKNMKLAFLSGDYREYIPSACLPEYLDFDKYPLYSL